MRVMCKLIGTCYGPREQLRQSRCLVRRLNLPAFALGLESIGSSGWAALWK